jgi:hypothetical protein
MKQEFLFVWQDIAYDHCKARLFHEEKLITKTITGFQSYYKMSTIYTQLN